MRELRFQEKMDGFRIRLMSYNSKMLTYITIVAPRDNAGACY